LPWLPWNINSPNPQFSKVHLTNLNLNNFKIIEAMELKIDRGNGLQIWG
jgi:hypothetical protein